MKKLLTLVLALGLTLSLAACGGADVTKALDAFNKVSDQYDALGTLVNENLDLMDATITDPITEIGTALAGYKTELASKDIKQERADEIVTLLEPLPAQLTEMKTAVEEIIAGGGAAAGMTDEQYATLDQLTIDLIAISTKYDEQYDSFNEETKAFVDGMVGTLEITATALESRDSITVEQADELIAGTQELITVAQDGWAQIEAQLAG